MTVQGRYESLNGLVTTPIQPITANVNNQNTTGQNIAVQNAQLTGNAPLLSATTPAQNQMAIQTGDVNSSVNSSNNSQQTYTMAQVPPAPSGCGATLDCQA